MIGAIWKNSIKAGMSQEAKDARTAATKGMRLTIDGGSGLKDTTRQAVRDAQLGPRVERTVRSAVYPRSGTSLSPAGSVFSKAPQILRGFSEGSLIRPRGGGRYLAIPTDDAPRRGGGQITAAEAVQRFGDPDYIRAQSGVLLMVFEVSSGPQGRGYRRSRRGDRQQVVMFVLVRQTKLPVRLNPARIVETVGARLKTNIALSWPERTQS